MTRERSRRVGVRLNANVLDDWLARRGLTARSFSKIAHIHEVTLSRARHGYPVRESTLRAITSALLQIPLLAGSEQLVADQIEEA